MDLEQQLPEVARRGSTLLLISLILDQYGLMNLPAREINTGRSVGVTFVLLGMIMELWLTPSFTNTSNAKVNVASNLSAIKSTPIGTAKSTFHLKN